MITQWQARCCAWCLVSLIPWNPHNLPVPGTFACTIFQVGSGELNSLLRPTALLHSGFLILWLKSDPLVSGKRHEGADCHPWPNANCCHCDLERNQGGMLLGEIACAASIGGQRGRPHHDCELESRKCGFRGDFRSQVEDWGSARGGMGREGLGPHVSSAFGRVIS